MPIGRRLATLLIALALVALPAVALRAVCFGKSCDRGTAAASGAVPFCSLPAPQRALLAAGFRQDRSPDLMAATPADGPGVRTRLNAGTAVPWPSSGGADTKVPLVFLGEATTGRGLADGIGLDQIAPTLAEMMAFRRPHPGVRSGTAVTGVAARSSARTRLVVLIAWKGVGTVDLHREPAAWPFLRATVAGDGGTLSATTGSLPLDPAASLTTIGTGGLPSQHGVVGTLLRGPEGNVARAWSRDAPGSVIATLADDLDEAAGQRSFVAAVLSSPSDRGIVGDGWYGGTADRDTIVVSDTPVPDVRRILHAMPTDAADGGVLGVVLDGRIRSMDRATRAIVHAIGSQVPSAAFVVTATGSLRGSSSTDAGAVRDEVEVALGGPASVGQEMSGTSPPVVEAIGSDGFFLDREALADRALTGDGVAASMRAVRGPTGDPLFTEVYPSFAVAFSRFC